MTQLVTTFYYDGRLLESAVRALGHVGDVYGVRRITFDEKAHAIEVEYDKSRLTENDIAALLRDAGISSAKRLARGLS
jgi:hypothetical protein